MPVQRTNLNMTKIFLDTNVFIDFYRSNIDPVTMLDELLRYKDHLVSTTQTIREFQRNRSHVIRESITSFEKSIPCNGLFTSSVIRTLPEFAAFMSAKASTQSAAKDVIIKLNELYKNPQNDKVASAFETISASLSDKDQISQPIFNAAQRRKLLGSPPTSSTKYTIGDEVTWEILLDTVKDNLVVVTRDRTYHDNYIVLAYEFRERTQRSLIKVTDKLSEAITELGEKPTVDFIKSENELQREIAAGRVVQFGHYGDSGLYTDLKSAQEMTLCPYCNSYNSNANKKCWKCQNQLPGLPSVQMATPSEAHNPFLGIDTT